MADRDNGEQRQLIAVNALCEMRTLSDDVHGAERIIVDFNWEQPLGWTYQTAIPSVNDQRRTASSEFRGLVCLNDAVTDL